MERMLFPKRIQNKIKATKEDDEICLFFFFFCSFIPVLELRTPIMVGPQLWFASSNSESLSLWTQGPRESLTPCYEAQIGQRKIRATSWFLHANRNSLTAGYLCV